MLYSQSIADTLALSASGEVAVTSLRRVPGARGGKFVFRPATIA
jgi:hypothetical protein